MGLAAIAVVRRRRMIRMPVIGMVMTRVRGRIPMIVRMTMRRRRGHGVEAMRIGHVAQGDSKRRGHDAQRIERDEQARHAYTP